VGDTDVAHQFAHVSGAKHISDHATAFVQVKMIVVHGCYACGILPSVLQHLQSVI
jgi:hypothetical protein